MYSYEIDKMLKFTNYKISSETYDKICQNSSQISRVKYSPYGDCFELELGSQSH